MNPLPVNPCRSKATSRLKINMLVLIYRIPYDLEALSTSSSSHQQSIIVFIRQNVQTHVLKNTLFLFNSTTKIKHFTVLFFCYATFQEIKTSSFAAFNSPKMSLKRSNSWQTYLFSYSVTELLHKQHSLK